MLAKFNTSLRSSLLSEIKKTTNARIFKVIFSIYVNVNKWVLPISVLNQISVHSVEHKQYKK